MTGHEFVMTDYFAADCFHCKNFAPIWSKAASISHADAAWKTAECYAPGWKAGHDASACEAQKIQSFPTVKLLHYTPDGKIDRSWNFDGPRTPQALETFAIQKIADFRSGEVTNRCVQSAASIPFMRQSILSTFL